MRRSAFFLFISLLVTSYLLLATVAVATDYASSNFKVSDPVVNELGGYASSSNFQLWGSIPFIEPRLTSSTNFGNYPDFFGNPSSTSSLTPTSSSSGGGAGGLDGVQPLKSKPGIDERIRKSVDFNKDGFVNFIDFSILLYYFDKNGTRIIPFDLNDDGAVDMVDISIFMYFWDGN